MALPASGAISLNQVNVELGLSGTTTISMNQASVRTLFGVPSGAISMSNGYGKANQFSFTITSNQANANLRTLALAAGWPGTAKVVATINGGVYVYSTSTGSAGLTINGSFPGGVSLVNNGFIVGMGGDGGFATNTGTPVAGSAGGLALSVGVGVTITNNGTIGGGGGGGGGGNTVLYQYGEEIYYGGGGGGGRSGLSNSSGGPSGGFYGGSAGGAGTNSSAGTGGSGFLYAGPNYTGGYGGNGGNWGTAGNSGGAGGQGGNGATGGGAYSYGPGAGGGGGAGGAVTGNSSITWLAFGTRLGSVS